MKNQKQTGVTLIELIVGMGLLAFFAVGIASYMRGHTLSLMNQQQKTFVQGELREFLSRLEKVALGSTEVAVGGLLNLQIRSALSGRCLTVDRAALNNLADATNIYQWDCLGEPIQLWRLQHVFSYSNNRGGYQVIARHSNKCMEVQDSEVVTGSNVQQGSCLGETQLNQVWKLEQPTAGAVEFLLKPQHALNQCLDISGGQIANASNIQQETCNSGARQKWTIINPSRPGFVPKLNLNATNPTIYSELDFAQRNRTGNFIASYFVTECVAKPADLPTLPAAQDCMQCPANQMPVVTNGLGTRLFPPGSGAASMGAFAGSLCVTEDYNNSALSLRLIGYAQEAGNQLISYQLNGSIPKSTSGIKRNKILAK